jgi:Sap, sulfolipid-1-addressing protein
MWTSVLVLATAMNFEPIRIGLIALMLSKPRPAVQLLAFIAGSFAMSITVGLPVLFVFHRRLFGATHTDGSKAQIVIGVVILMIAVLLATDLAGSRFKLSPRARSLLQGDSPWFSGVMGMSASLPSVDYLALLVLIAASGATPVTQASALLTFVAVANTLAALPLGSYLVAPPGRARY